jgi:hypothetical protein
MDVVEQAASVCCHYFGYVGAGEAHPVLEHAAALPYGVFNAIRDCIGVGCPIGMFVPRHCFPIASFSHWFKS